MKSQQISKILGIVLFLALAAFTNTNEGLNVIKSKKGFVFIFNDSVESFILEISGKKFANVDPEELIFSIDGQIIQFTVIPIYEFFSPNSPLDTLEQHFKFEIDFISKNYLSDIDELRPKMYTTKSNRRAFYWELALNVPPNDTSSETVVKQIYSTTNTDKFIIMLSSPITRANNYRKCKKKILEAMLNVQFSKNPYDVEKIRAYLKEK
ncbi:MAG: hypothetical protein ACK4SO_03050 [Candidatus Kapaibacteriota bacterium]